MVLVSSDQDAAKRPQSSCPHAADRRKLGASALSPNQRSCARRRLRVAIAAHRHARARAAARRKPGRNGKRADVVSFVARNRGEHYADLGNVRADAGAPRISTEAEAASAGRVDSSAGRPHKQMAFRVCPSLSEVEDVPRGLFQNSIVSL